jgi:hypothetical protein
LADQNSNYRTLGLLGLVITFPFILASGPLAAYFLSKYVFVRFMGMPEKYISLCLVLGFLASGIQIFRLLKQIQDFESKMNRKKNNGA